MPPKKRKDDAPAAATPAAKKQPPPANKPAAAAATKPPAPPSARKAAGRKRQVSLEDDDDDSTSTSSSSSGSSSGTADSAVMYESRAAAPLSESATPGMLAVAALFAGAQPRFEPCRLPTEEPELRSLFARAVADVDGFEHEPPVLGRASHVVTEEHPGAIVSVLATGVAFPSIVRWAPRAYATPRTSELYRLLLVAGTRTPTEYRSARDASGNPTCAGSSWKEIAPERREDASARFTRVLQLHAVACPASPWSAKGKRRAAEPRPPTPSAGRDAAATATLAMPATLDVGSVRPWAVRDVRWYGGCEGALACAAAGAFDPTDRAAGRRGVFAAVTNVGHAALYALHDEVGVAAGGAEGTGKSTKEKSAEKRRREAARHVVLHPFAACQLPCETAATTCVFHVKAAEGRVALYVGLADGDVAAASLLQHSAAPGKRAAPGCTIAFVMRVRVQQGPLNSLVLHTGWHVRHDDRVLLDRETLRPLGTAPTVPWPTDATATPERPQWPARDRVTRRPAGRDIEENAVLLAGQCGEPFMVLQVGAKGGRHVMEAVRLSKNASGPVVTVPGGGILVGGSDSNVRVEFPPESQLPAKDDLSKKWPSNQLRSGHRSTKASTMSSICYGEDDRRRSASKACPIDALVTCATTDGIVSLLRYPAFLALSCETLSTPVSRACTVCFGGGFQSSWARAPCMCAFRNEGVYIDDTPLMLVSSISWKLPEHEDEQPEVSLNVTMAPDSQMVNDHLQETASLKSWTADQYTYAQDLATSDSTAMHLLAVGLPGGIVCVIPF